MRPLQLLALTGLALATAVGACGGKQAAPPPTPQVNADSAAAAERARQDSIAAKARADSLAAAQAADSIARARAADSAAAAARAAEGMRTAMAAMIHFDFDKATIRSDDQSVLDQKVQILQANPALKIRISGHCDERGSDEYNLALGNRRATAAKQYLVSHGIDAGRIETASYGEERPIAPGHDEASWSQNRRDEFEITSGGGQ